MDEILKIEIGRTFLAVYRGGAKYYIISLSHPTATGGKAFKSTRPNVHKVYVVHDPK